MQAHKKCHSRWFHAIRKRVITEKKRGVKNMKIRNCFCKYAIEDDQAA